MSQTSFSLPRIVKQGFLRPFDIATPMTRTHFWAFYLANSFAFAAFGVVQSLAKQAVAMTGIQALSIATNLLILGILLWLLLALLCAIARRMRDARVSRKFLIAALWLGACFFISFLRDVLENFAMHEANPAEPMIWSGATMVVFFMSFSALLGVVAGLLRKSRPQPETHVSAC